MSQDEPLALGFSSVAMICRKMNPLALGFPVPHYTSQDESLALGFSYSRKRILRRASCRVMNLSRWAFRRPG